MQYDFADILVTVVERNASDLHITPGVAPMLRMRGSLAPIDGLPRLTPTDTREIVYSILNNSQRQQLETHNQLDFSYGVPGKGRFRVNAFHQRGSVSAAFRLIPSKTVPIEQLGLPPVIRDFSKKPRGLVLVTGPTGSGKSTTLASMINEASVVDLPEPVGPGLSGPARLLGEVADDGRQAQLLDRHRCLDGIRRNAALTEPRWWNALTREALAARGRCRRSRAGCGSPAADAASC